MKSKHIWQQIIIGVVIWIVGSAIWGFISNAFHFPGFDWGYVGSTAGIVFFVLLTTVIIPFIQQSMALYFLRKRREMDREEQDYQERRQLKTP